MHSHLQLEPNGSALDGDIISSMLNATPQTNTGGLLLSHHGHVGHGVRRRVRNTATIVASNNGVPVNDRRPHRRVAIAAAGVLAAGVGGGAGALREANRWFFRCRNRLRRTQASRCSMGSVSGCDGGGQTDMRSGDACDM
jgi:hypothetical protein